MMRDPLTAWAAEPAPGGPQRTGHDQDPAGDSTRETGWTVEGVALCPGDCGLYFDFCGTPQDLRKFISEHDCAFAQTGENHR